MSAHEVSRRLFLGAVAAGTVACSDTPSDPAADRRGESDRPGDGAYRESPLLTARVEAGELPPIEERLPDEPYVVQPEVLLGPEFGPVEVGRFGGTMELAQEAPSGDPHIYIGINEPLIWAPGAFDYSGGFEGNVAAGWEANDDDTVFTFHLRKGLRWSDGEPVTIDDVRFAFEDVLFNPDITPAFPIYLRSGLRAEGQPVQLEIIDDLTFSVSFSEPYGTFPAQVAIAQWHSYTDFIKPRHYLEQFHQKYADPAEFRELLRAESVEEDQWFNLFNAKQLAGSLWNVTNEQGLGHPTLTPWVMTRASTSVFRYERNPYYFKVDVEGNQLPYIDGLRSQVVQDKETLTSRALFGEFDYLGERASLRQLPLIAEKADAGEVTMYLARMHRLPISFALNLTYPDPVWREVVRDVRFRQALSAAINREEIIDNTYLGEFASLPEETNPSQYDPDEANRLLDDMGMSETNDDGFRLGPDGSRFRIPFEIQDLSEDHIPMAELLAEYWKNVGVFTTVRPIDGTTRTERQSANDLQATGIWAHHDIWPSAGWDDYLPLTYWGPLWTEWNNTGGESGEEPPPEIKELYEAHGRFMSARIGTPESQGALDAILESYRENVWTFNPVEHSFYPTFWTKRIKNVPEGVGQDLLGIVAMYSMEQWYIEE